MRYESLVFDLFGTLVLFRPKVSARQPARQTWRSALPWLGEQVERDLPGIPFDDFLDALMAVTEEIVRARPPDYIEVASEERFSRALARVGLDARLAREKARGLCRVHMQHLAAGAELPPEHMDVLDNLRRHYRMGLVSNFDHGPTAREILSRHGIAERMQSVVISADFGRRKPHPSIFAAALQELKTDPDAALYIGDTARDDVHGARAAGMDVAWINGRGAELPPGPAPTYIMSGLTELPGILAAA